MNHFLGFFIEDESRKKIAASTDKISETFSDIGIPIRWIKPSNYHIKLQTLSGDIGPIKKLYISKKVQEIFKQPVAVSMGDIKLGTNRKMSSLLYMEIKNGGDALRELKYEMVKTLSLKDSMHFLPHVAIGRINKDLSNQEISNIIRDIRNVSESIMKNEIQFDMSEIDLVRIKDGNYEILRNFKVSS